MKTRFILLLMAMLCSSTLAQIVVEPDADLWGGGVTNPSGLAAIPILQYDPANGEMWIHTVGLNGVSDLVKAVDGLRRKFRRHSNCSRSLEEFTTSIRRKACECGRSMPV